MRAWIAGLKLGLAAWVLGGLGSRAVDAVVAGAGRGFESEYLIRAWQAEDGLPQSTVTSVVQTRDGYLWIGTAHGVARFDGVRFVVYGAHNTPEIQSNRILTLWEDAEGGLWMGTEGGGVSRWFNGRFTTYDVWEGLAHNVVAGVGEDGAGRVLVATRGGLSVWREGRMTPWNGPEGWMRGPVRSLAMVERGRCLALTSAAVVEVGADGVWGVDLPEGVAGGALDGMHRGPTGVVWAYGRGLVLQRTPGAGWGVVPGLGGEVAIGAMLETAGGDLWVGTREGSLMRRRGGRWLTIPQVGEGGFRPIRCLAEDREGNVWVGTDGGGLVRLKPRRLNTLRVRDGLASESIVSIADAGDGGVWLAANSGGITYWRDGVIRPREQAGPKDGWVGPLLRARDGSVWLGTAGAGLVRWKDGTETRWGRAQGFPEPRVLSLFEDREGRLWIGTDDAGVFVHEAGRFRNFSIPEGFPARTITAMAQDPDGNLWFGSNGGGLYRYADGRFSLYSRREGWGGDFIRALCVDREGALWIGTGGSGLTRMKDGWFRTITTRDGLVDDVVSQILEDQFGNLWLGTNRGICRITPEEIEGFVSGRSSTLSVLGFGRSEGMESLECTGGYHPAAVMTEGGGLWFATVKGAVFIDPAPLMRASGAAGAVPPLVRIEEVWVDGERVVPSALRSTGQGAVPRLVLGPGSQRWEVRYTALGFTAPEKIRFRYRLEGLDPDWVEAGESRVARFGKLPPGDYRFRVIACNSDGVWDESQVGLEVILRPQFWQQRWFQAGAVVLLGLAVAGGIRAKEMRRVRQAMARLERQHAVERERRRIAQDMHDELGSRLAKVSFLCELVAGGGTKPAELGTRVSHIARASRAVLSTLDEMVWAVNPQNDTLEHLAAYIGEYAKEFLQATEIGCEVRIPVDLPARPVAAEARHHLFLAVQESLSNVLKHSRATMVRVAMELRDSRFVLIIEDNGQGFRPRPGDGCGTREGAPLSPPGRNGLTNMRRRVEAIGAGLRIEARDGGGTRVTLELGV